VFTGWVIVYSYFIFDLGTVKLLARGGGDSVLGNSSKHYPRHRGSTVWLFQNPIWNNCFITLSIEEKRKKLIVFAKMLIIKLFQFYNNDVRVCAGNSRNSLLWTFLEFQKTVKNTKLLFYKVSGNSRKRVRV